MVFPLQIFALFKNGGRGWGGSSNLVGIICPLVRIGLTDLIIEIILINQVKNFYEGLVLLTYPTSLVCVQLKKRDSEKNL